MGNYDLFKNTLFALLVSISSKPITKKLIGLVWFLYKSFGISEHILLHNFLESKTKTKQ